MGSVIITEAVGTMTSADATVPGPDACTANDKESCVMAARGEGIHFRISAYMFELGCVMHSFLIGEQMLLLLLLLLLLSATRRSTWGIVRPEGEGWDGGIWGAAVRVRPRNPLPLMRLDLREEPGMGFVCTVCAHSVTLIVARRTAGIPDCPHTH
jgi:hypothetical protein